MYYFIFVIFFPLTTSLIQVASWNLTLLVPLTKLTPSGSQLTTFFTLSQGQANLTTLNHKNNNQLEIHIANGFSSSSSKKLSLYMTYREVSNNSILTKTDVTSILETMQFNSVVQGKSIETYSIEYDYQKQLRLKSEQLQLSLIFTEPKLSSVFCLSHPFMVISLLLNLLLAQWIIKFLDQRCRNIHQQQFGVQICFLELTPIIIASKIFNEPYLPLIKAIFTDHTFDLQTLFGFFRISLIFCQVGSFFIYLTLFFICLRVLVPLFKTENFTHLTVLGLLLYDPDSFSIIVMTLYNLFTIFNDKPDGQHKQHSNWKDKVEGGALLVIYYHYFKIMQDNSIAYFPYWFNQIPLEPKIKLTLSTFTIVMIYLNLVIRVGAELLAAKGYSLSALIKQVWVKMLRKREKRMEQI